MSKLENTENIQFFRHDSTDKCVEKKRSVSKGKGLSVMQVNGLLHSNLKKAYGKAVNISQPSDFNRTTFIRRPGYWWYCIFMIYSNINYDEPKTIPQTIPLKSHLSSISSYIKHIIIHNQTKDILGTISDDGELHLYEFNKNMP